MNLLKGVRKQTIPEFGIVKIMDAATLLFYVLLAGSFTFLTVSADPRKNLTAMECSQSTHPSSCDSYLYFDRTGSSQSLSQIATNFNVSESDIFYAPPSLRNTANDYMISAKCHCDPGVGYFAQTSYIPSPSDGNFSIISKIYYSGLAFSNSSVLQVGEPVQVNLLCGCPPLGWSSIVAYICKKLDTVFELNSTFSSSETLIQSINGIANIGIIDSGENLFIPTNSTPAPFPPAPVRPKSSSGGNISIGMIIGLVAAGMVVLLSIILVTILVVRRRRENYVRRVSAGKPSSIYSGNIIPSSGSASKWSGSGNLNFVTSLFNFGKPSSGSVNNNVKRSITLPREAMNVFDQEKPVVFNYEEILAATNNFSEDQKVGQGAFGTVYSGSLRQQDVAIKQMKATKSREFLAELKVLCKVHHTNLVELIGYSAGDQSLFLIYEYAENGALSDHLHNPTEKNHLPLSWTARVQIALDAARGLEYIHEHTKTHYVHRDVKTSNILLDGYFRAKVADFGLAKLVEQSVDCNAQPTTKVVGTFGYMGPEYALGGHATSKTDVYAFGVVIFELITGRHALARTYSSPSDPTPSSRRSLTSVMLNVLGEKDPDKEFRDHVDKLLGDCYPFECAFKMAKLARACVSEEPGNRPDMRQIVFTLSQTLLTSIEWEATLAGSSQIFSGLVQGR